MYKHTDNLEVIGYFGIDFAGCMDSRKSTSSYVHMLSSGAMSWRSMKQTLTTISTIEAEFVSCLEATSLGVWLKSFISGLRVIDSIEKTLRLYYDNLINRSFFLLRMIKVEIEVNISTSNT